MSDLGLLVAVSLAGGVGSALRHLTDTALPSRVRARYPWGTVLVNLTGSFALGLLVGLDALPAPGRTIVGVGLIGGYTTFSTASLDTVRLLLQRRPGAAALHGLAMPTACVLAALAGLSLPGA